MSTSIAKLRWNPCWRIIPKQSPALQIFKSICKSVEIEKVTKLEAMTGLKFIDKSEDIDVASEESDKSRAEFEMIDAITGFLSPIGGRFTDGSFGVFQVYKTLETAIDETKTSLEEFVNSIGSNKFKLRMNAYVMELKGNFHDIRGQKKKLPYLYLNDDNEYSSAFAKNLWNSGSDGIVYDSFTANSQCVSVFNPARLSKIKLEKEISFAWDGKKFSAVWLT